MRRNEAQNLANTALSLLGDVCLQTAIAGSIRRGKPEVKDVEIVVESAYDHIPNLFGQTGTQSSRLEEKIAHLLATGKVTLDTKTKRNGPKYKRLRLPGHEAVVELFIANAANWGNILAIRTGDADFSHALVTSRLYGGLMPSDLKQKDGTLWRGSQPIECFTEDDFFFQLGIFNVPDPTDRTIATARRLAQRWAA